ncbi:MAG: PQQ-binding-like beta-propeller repeat protein [Gammaproteobacteria bacterium]|nr:PQQ-binding-like beta-propeller repeat protein [Gammaproteobacteria bacterium]MBT4494764.1 PQQ-binding-like beta-propeller repeat protein [Gammaproteobacteria bacterium]MBT7370171.1 PQQ-binding-like beta-propeller repeat protein [Gammaproteobacteria bacterium]
MPDITFSLAQADSGKDAYTQHCAGCHGENLEGRGFAAQLSGERFSEQWKGRSAAVLSSYIRSMPMAPVGNPGSLSDETYTNILAFLLQANGLKAGKKELPEDVDVLREFAIPLAEDDLADPNLNVAGEPSESNLLRNLPSLSHEMLENPAPEDWVNWRRTYDGKGFTPLRQINKENVSKLKVAWSAPLRGGENMPSPLVHQGVMFFHTFPDTVLALDASNGNVLWRYQHDHELRFSKKNGIALAGDKVLVPTSDLHLIALNARTGKLIWDHAIATDSPKSELYQLRSAPLVAGNKVIQGITSFFMPKGSFIVAVDIDSGEEVWRFNTIARPGETGGNTWNDLPLDQRNGGSVWVPGTYDADLNLVYFGPAPTYDTGPLLHAIDKEGVSNDALFTNTTVALNPDTGELVWYYQHLANDQWDLDWAFERQIVHLPFGGETRKAVLTTGKMAIIEALDAATGEYLFSIDLGLQNVVTAIDPKTGAKTINPAAIPDLTQTRLICPIAFGARSWPPTSFNPRSKYLYLPLSEGCMTGGPDGFRGLLSSGIGIGWAPHPASSDGNMGRLQAVNLETRQLAWSFRQPTPLVSAVLATGGGLVFVGDLDPSLKAFDDISGELLWQTKLDAIPGSNVMSYSVDGKQYIAIVVGQINNVVRDWKRTYNLFAPDLGLPQIDWSKEAGPAITVFSVDGTAE